MSQQPVQAGQPHGADPETNTTKNSAPYGEKGFWVMLGNFIVGFFACVAAIAEAINAVCSVAEICCLVA